MNTLDRLRQLADEAERYPLPLRMAVRLYREGVSCGQLHASLTQYGEFRRPTMNAVFNHLSDLHYGTTQIHPELDQLAKQL